MTKRLLDILLAGTALIALSPLMVAVALALRFSGEGEIFYRQERLGRRWQPFAILKFATMLKDSPNMAGGDISSRNDPRILPLGHFLRSTKFNELPQLLNIVVGDMSIIGPRPLTPRIAAWFTPEYRTMIADLRPGLSGVGSIVFRDEETLLAGANDRAEFYRSMIVPHKAALEQWYASRQSMALDLKLMVLTILAVVYPRLDVVSWLPGLPVKPSALRSVYNRASRSVR